MKILFKYLIAFFIATPFATNAQISQPVGPGGRPQTFTNHGVLIGQGTSNVVASSAGTTGLCLLSGGASADPNWGSCAGGGSGTVVSVSVVNANGFNGTVANPTSTPAITLTTTATGMLKGNGTAISAATSGTDYSAGTSALGTGILKTTTGTGALSLATSGTDYSAGTSALGTGIVKTTTGTGALSVAVAADFPTLNQNTSGNAANVTGVVTVTHGGTGLSTVPANGQIPIGNGAGYTSATLTAGTGISINNTAGAITISSSGSGTPGLVYLQTITPSASASVNLLTAFSSTYDNYLVLFEGILPASTDSMNIRLANGGVVDSTSNYASCGFAGGPTTCFNTATALISFPCQSTLAGGSGCTGSITFKNVNSTTSFKNVRLETLTNTGASTYAAASQSYVYMGTASVSGFQLYWSGASNFAAQGSIKIYGYNN